MQLTIYVNSERKEKLSHSFPGMDIRKAISASIDRLPNPPANDDTITIPEGEDSITITTSTPVTSSNEAAANDLKDILEYPKDNDEVKIVREPEEDDELPF